MRRTAGLPRAGRARLLKSVAHRLTVATGRALARHGLRVLAARLPIGVPMADGVVREFPRSVARLTAAQHHPEFAQALRHYRGGDVLDVGAAFGALAVACAPLLPPGAHYAGLEPHPPNYARLLDCCAALAEHFPALKFTALPAAAGDGAPVAASFPLAHNAIPRYGHADEAAAGRTPAGTPPAPHPSLTLDALAPALGWTPGFLKVDVEGAEAAVLRGATELLRRHRPVVLLEIHPAWQPPGVRPEALPATLADLGYAVATLARNDLQWQVLALPRP